MRYTSRIIPLVVTIITLFTLPQTQAQEVQQAPQKPGPKTRETRGIRALLRYGQHSNFWKEVNALKNSDDPVAQTIGFMDKENYGAMEGIAKARLELLSRNEDYWPDYFNTMAMGFDISSLAGGEVYNRISPKIRGYLIWDVAFFANLSKQEAALGKSGWNWLVGSDFGIGRQKIVEGEAIDFLVETPIQESTLYFLGLNTELGYQSQFSDAMRFTYKGFFLPTFFYSQFDNNKYSYGVKKGSTRLRWRTELEQTYAFQAPKEGGVEIGAQLIGGQQPTPVRVLPRVWDSIHKLEFFPDYGTLVGIGGVARIFTSSRNLSLSTYGGYYGGYFGAGALINVFGVTLEGGTFGFEQTSKFHLRETRINYASLGYNHEW